MKLKVLFLLKDRSEYGKAYGLANSAIFVSDFLNKQGIESETQTAIDGNSVDKLVTAYDPTHVVIEALWVTPAKIQELLSIPRHQKRKWIIRIHSRPVFLANEGIAFPWFLGYKKLKLKQLVIAPNTKEFADDLANVYGSKTAFLPNVYYPMTNMPPKKVFNGYSIDIGCFGAIRPMKNHMTQAMAAVDFAKQNKLKLNFHVNQRMEGGGDAVLHNLRAYFENFYPHHCLIEHDWHNHEDFMGLIREMDMGLQVSLSETFNIVAADFVSADVPIVGSSQITWLPQMFQADPNSTQSIKNTLAYSWGWFGQKMKFLSKRGLLGSSKAAEVQWLKYLGV